MCCGAASLGSRADGVRSLCSLGAAASMLVVLGQLAAVPRTLRWEALSSASSEHFGRTHALGGIGSRLYASQKPAWIRDGCVLVSFDTLGEIEVGQLIHAK